MKNKKLFICILTVLLAVVCSSIFACSKKPSTSVVVDIQDETLTCYVFDEITLNVTTQNVTDDVTWSSSDTSVATVSDGVVTALNVGTATITATANGVKDKCTVQVLSSTSAPTITLNKTQISIEKDSEYTITAVVEWLENDVTDKVDLTWQLAHGAQDGIASITANGNSAVLRGLAYGTTEFYVSTTVGDAYVNQRILVSVVDTSVYFDSDELQIGANGKFELQMLTVDSLGEPVAVDFPQIDAYSGTQQILDVNYRWSSADENIVKIVDDKAVAVSAGTVDLYGEYQGHVVIVTVQVQRGVIELSDVVAFEKVNLQPATLQTQIEGSGEVYLDDVKVGDYSNGAITFLAEKFPKQSKDLGAREMKVNTNKASYMITANLYTMIINTKEELDLWHSHAYDNNDDGYYALGNNINYNGVYEGSRDWENDGYRWASTDLVGFRGTFDGCGYIIDGLKLDRTDSNGGSASYRGFVTLLAEGGVIKNVAFTNASNSAYGGYVCTWGCGTIENVYVHYAVGADTGYTDGNAAFGGTFLSTNNHRGTTKKMTVKNCFVDMSQTTLKTNYQSYIGGYTVRDKTTNTWDVSGTYVKVNDVYVVGSATTSASGDAKFSTNELVEGSSNYGLFTSASAMASDATVQQLIANWDNAFWGVKNGVPTPLSIIERGDLIPVDVPLASRYYTFSGNVGVYQHEDYTFTVVATDEQMDDFIILVNGEQVQLDPQTNSYTVQNVSGSLDIDVLHGYLESSGNNLPVVSYDADTDTWTAIDAVFLNNAYITKDYIEYMMSQGYTKVQVTMIPDNAIAVNVAYVYNGPTTVVYGPDDYSAGTPAKTATVNLTVPSQLDFIGLNDVGSGSAIKDLDSHIIISNITFLKDTM